MASPTCAFFESRDVVSGDVLLNKLEEVKQSVEVETFGCFSCVWLNCLEIVTYILLMY